MNKDKIFENLSREFDGLHKEIEEILYGIYEVTHNEFPSGYSQDLHMNCDCEYSCIYIHIDRETLGYYVSWNNSDMETEPYSNSRTIVIATSICLYDNLVDNIIEELKDNLETELFE